jgi:hypothetical protein
MGADPLDGGDLRSAARVFEQILHELDPQYRWIVSVGEDERAQGESTARERERDA